MNMTEEQDPRMRFISLDRVCFIQGGLEGLLQILKTRKWKSRRFHAYLLERPDVGGYYVFDRASFRECAKFLSRFELQRWTFGKLQEIFDIHEDTQSPSIENYQKADRPSVVLEGGTPKGVWVIVPIRPDSCASSPLWVRDHSEKVFGHFTDYGISFQIDSSKMTVKGKMIQEEIIRRTPHMDISVDMPLIPGKAFDMYIYADTAPSREIEEGEDIVIVAPPEVHEFEVEVYLIASSHFVLPDDRVKKIIIKRFEDRSNKAMFRMEVRREITNIENAIITALFSYRGRPSGKVSRTLAIASDISKEQIKEESSSQPPEHTEVMNIDAGARSPDLTVTITCHPDNDGRMFYCAIQTPLLEKYRTAVRGEWNLKELAPDLVRGYMADFIRPGIRDQQRLDSLQGAGVQFFDAAPKIFKEVFWELIDSNIQIKTILVVTDEPCFPWELMIPNRPRIGSDPEERSPLGVEFTIGRWITDQHLAPGQKVSIHDSYVLSPMYSGSSTLKHAGEEADFVCNNFNGETIKPARYEAFMGKMKEGGASLIHFICHGEGADPSGSAEGSPYSQKIKLEEDETLSSTEIRGNKDIGKACRKKKPFVFMNACEVGRLEPALTGVGGFAESFIRQGVTCVIAPLWSVKDDIAYRVAIDFYRKLLDNPNLPFAEILGEIRAKAYGAGGNEDTYAAYCFYGDPLTARENA